MPQKVSEVKRPYVKGGRSKRDRHLFHRYGIDEDKYNQLRATQKGLCKLCGKAKKSGKDRALSVDHNHQTGEIRGLLCYICNSTIGVIERLGLSCIKEYLNES